MKSLYSLMTLGFLVLVLLPLANGQTNEPATQAGNIHLNYKYYGDSIVLRWGFDHPQLWYTQRNKPVALWRRDVTNDGQYVKLGDFMPWDSTKIETTASQIANPDMLVVVLENLHRNWSNTMYAGYSSILEKNDNFFNRWSLVHLAADRSALAANAAGLRFVDHDVNPKTTYAYKVVTANNESHDHKVAFPVVKSFVPIIFDITEGDSSIVLSWEKKLHDYHYSAYWIEVSEDGRNYQRIHQAPYVQMTDENLPGDHRFYTISIPAPNYRKKYYRLIGIDAFSDESKPSESISGMGRDRTPPAKPIVWVDTMETHLTKNIHWDHPNLNDVHHYDLERTYGNETLYLENWSNRSKKEKLDTLINEGVYKYRLIAVDTAGNKQFSDPVYAKVFDLIPPSAPQKPRAVADTSGVIMITWDEHAEKDIIGYNIYAADGKDRNFIKLNPHIYRARVFADSLSVHMLNEARYYTIVAVDNDYMLSPFSDTIQLVRPDVIPPSPALIGDYKVLPNGVRLTLLPSSSRDVKSHELQRRTGDEPWTIVQSFTSYPGTVIDTTVKVSTEYVYRFVAIDNNGLISKSVKDLHIITMQPKQTSPVLNYTIDGEMLTLMMEPPADEYSIYRAIGEGKFQRIEATNNNQFIEKIKPDQQFRYRVRNTSNASGQNPFSNEVNIQIQPK